MKSYSYRGHKIVPKLDFGSQPGKGWIVSDAKGYTNAAPGATWFKTITRAKFAIDVLVAIGGEEQAQIFWEIMQPNTWKVGQKDPDFQYGGGEGSMSHGRFSATVKGGVIVEVKTKPLEVHVDIIRALRKLGIKLRNVIALYPAK